MSNADIMYIPAQNGAEYTAVSAAKVTKAAYELLLIADHVGEVDIFGELVTAEKIEEMQLLRRQRAATLLRRVADELDKAP